MAKLLPATPRYELRVCAGRPGQAEYEVWQLPSPATPQVTAPTRIAGLRGRNLELVEHRVLRKLTQAGIRVGGDRGGRGQGAPGGRREGARAGRRQGAPGGRPLSEDMALTLGLLFRCLAPMRNRENMRMVAEGIETMQREEAAYWLGMAMHRKRPRRVLAALRLLLTEPRSKSAPALAS